MRTCSELLSPPCKLFMVYLSVCVVIVCVCLNEYLLYNVCLLCVCLRLWRNVRILSLLLYRRVWLVNQDISPYKQRFVQYDVLCLYTGMSLCTGHPVQTEKYLFCLALHHPRSTGAYNYNPRSLLTCNLPHSLSVLLPPLQVSQVKYLCFCRSDCMAF